MQLQKATRPYSVRIVRLYYTTNLSVGAYIVWQSERICSKRFLFVEISRNFLYDRELQISGDSDTTDSLTSCIWKLNDTIHSFKIHFYRCCEPEEKENRKLKNEMHFKSFSVFANIVVTLLN